jgi:hypothetical protein
MAFVGGQDAGYLEHIHPQPHAAARLAIVRAAGQLVDKHLKLAEFDGDDSSLRARIIALALQELSVCQIAAEAGCSTGSLSNVCRSPWCRSITAGRKRRPMPARSRRSPGARSWRTNCSCALATFAAQAARMAGHSNGGIGGSGQQASGPPGGRGLDSPGPAETGPS